MLHDVDAHTSKLYWMLSLFFYVHINVWNIKIVLDVSLDLHMPHMKLKKSCAFVIQCLNWALIFNSFFLSKSRSIKVLYMYMYWQRTAQHEFENCIMHVLLSHLAKYTFIYLYHISMCFRVIRRLEEHSDFFPAFQEIVRKLFEILGEFFKIMNGVKTIIYTFVLWVFFLSLNSTIFKDI